MNGEVQLWQLAVDGPPPPDCVRLLTAEDQVRLARLMREESRDELVWTRLFVRHVLSHYVEGPLRFTVNEYGRPETGSACFSVSSTTGMILCAVAESDVGVDVEDLERSVEFRLAQCWFAPSEVAALRALPLEQQRARFFDYWTLKESYIKARGIGLAIPLDSFAFAFDPLRFEAEDAEKWDFVQLKPSERHIAAVAMRRGSRLRALPPLNAVDLAHHAVE